MKRNTDQLSVCDSDCAGARDEAQRRGHPRRRRPPSRLRPPDLSHGTEGQRGSRRSFRRFHPAGDRAVRAVSFSAAPCAAAALREEVLRQRAGELIAPNHLVDVS